MFRQQRSETSLSSDYQNINEYIKSCKNIISLIIDSNNTEPKNISKITCEITKLLELGHLVDPMPKKITDLLYSSTFLFCHAFQNDHIQLFSSLASVFNSNKSFYINNSYQKIPSYTWAIVVDNFIQSYSLESIMKRLQNETNPGLTSDHFLSFSSILKSICSRIESKKYQDILRRALKYLINFLIKNKRCPDDSFIQLYSQYFSLCSTTFQNPDDFSDFLTLLNYIYNYKESNMNDFICIQVLSLFHTPAKNLSITQDFCDFIFSKTDVKITKSTIDKEQLDDSFLSFLICVLENKGFDAFDSSSLNYLFEILNSNIDYSKLTDNFVNFASDFIILKNLQDNKIESNGSQPNIILSQFVIKNVPLHYEYLLFNSFKFKCIENMIVASQKKLADIYSHVDSSMIPATIQAFRNKLERATNDFEFASILNTLLDFSMKIEENLDFKAVGINRHIDHPTEKSHQITLNVSHPNGKLQIECDKKLTVSELKGTISLKLQVDPKHLLLFHEKRGLQDHLTIENCQINNGSEIEVSGTFQPLPIESYPTVILSKDFPLFLLGNLQKETAKIKQESIHNFLNYLPTELNTLKTVEDGNNFILHLRSAKSSIHLQYLLETASSQCNNQAVVSEYARTRVFSSLCDELSKKKRIEADNACSFLSFFLSFFSPSFNGLSDRLVPSLLKLLSIEGKDELFVSIISLLNKLHQSSPHQTLNAVKSNLKELSRAIQGTPESSFENLTQFILSLNDRLFFELFCYSYSNDENRFTRLLNQLRTGQDEEPLECIKKCLLIMREADEVPFEKLFNLFNSKLNKKILDQNKFIIDDLLEIEQKTDSNKTRSLILESLDHLSSLSDTSRLAIHDFIVNLSKTTLNDYDFSLLSVERSKSGQKVLLSGRSDINSVLQILYHISPFNFNESQNCIESVTKIQSLFLEMALCERKFINIGDITGYFTGLQRDAATFFNDILKNAPEGWKDGYRGVLRVEITGEFQRNFRSQSRENFLYLTVPILGFERLPDALLYLFNNTEHFTGETRYFAHEINMSIDALKSMKFIKTPSVMALELIRFNKDGNKYVNDIDVPLILDVSDLVTENKPLNYNLDAAIVIDPISSDFNAFVRNRRCNSSWILFDNNKNFIEVDDENEINMILKNSYLVFYTLRESNIVLADFFENMKVSPSMLEWIDKANDQIRIQNKTYNKEIVKYMYNHAEPVALLSYFIHVICRSQDKILIEKTIEKLTNTLTVDQMINYFESDFNIVVDALSKSQNLNYIIDIFSFCFKNYSKIESLFGLMNHFLNQLKFIVYYQITPISHLLLKFVSFSPEFVDTCRKDNWHQKMILIIFLIFDCERGFEYFSNLDLSPLFDTLSILISKEYVPNRYVFLFNIKDKVFHSKKHIQSYIALLFRLRLLNMIELRNDFQNLYLFLNNFQSILEKGNVPQIPPFMRTPEVFTQLQYIIKLGNDSLRSNLTDTYLPKLLSYVQSEDEEVKKASKDLILSLCDDNSKSSYDTLIRKLLSMLPEAPDCSPILEVIAELIKKSQLKDIDYLNSIFNCSNRLHSNNLTNSLISFYQVYDHPVLEENLPKIVESINDNYEELIDFILKFSGQSIDHSLSSPKWEEIAEKVDVNH
ncbi:hypothetical protein M9Y10_022474 [Tritrichomonas musculus]|uniref:USP domain-containing protein n=1 Tax=Tritrichomonas musculus TaxID=1915356 RepID=A0ABR2KSY6_9EUKA